LFFENELARNLARSPKVRYLQERLVICVALSERRHIRITAKYLGSDSLAVALQLGGAEDAWNFHEPVARIRLAQRRAGCDHYFAAETCAAVTALA
jgi:hypothetical protein